MYDPITVKRDTMKSIMREVQKFINLGGLERSPREGKMYLSP